MGSIRWITRPNGFIKVIALLINILIISLMSIYGLPAYGMSVSELLIIILTIGGLILVLVVLLVGYGIDENFLQAPAQFFLGRFYDKMKSVINCIFVMIVCYVRAICLTERDNFEDNGVTGSVLGVVSGTLIIVKTKHPPEFIIYDRAAVLYSYGTLTLINALLFAADAFFAFKNKSRRS